MELERQPDDPDAIDRDPSRAPDQEGPHPGREPGEDEGMMRLPGEEGPEVIGARPEPDPAGQEPEAPDAVGSNDEPW